MKKLLVVCLFMGFIATAAVAQDKKQMDKTEWNKKVKEELKLTPEQIVKYEALSKEYDTKFETLHSDASLSKDQQKEQKISLKKEKEAKLFEFLTPEQQTKYKEIIEKKMKDMKH